MPRSLADLQEPAFMVGRYGTVNNRLPTCFEAAAAANFGVCG